VRVVRLRPAFASFADTGSGYVEVGLHLTGSESLLGGPPSPRAASRGFGETDFACKTLAWGRQNGRG
jgi:hypothetical protein